MTDEDYVSYVHARATALRRAAYLLSGDEHQADDLVQETITKLYARWNRLNGVENLDAYVHSIMVRLFLDEKRRGWWKVRLGALPERPASPGAGVEPDERAAVREALSRVPARQQAVLVLRFLCDQPVADVARVMKCSEGTVKSQTAHGLAALRRILGDRVHALGSMR